MKATPIINLKASNPIIPVELHNENGDVYKFVVERIGSNKIRFITLSDSDLELKEKAKKSKK